MHILEFEYRIERCLREIVQSHFPLDWKEDVLTHELARSLRELFHDTTLYGTRYPLKIEWEIYKLHGTRESNHGDIGLLFRTTSNWRCRGRGRLHGSEAPRPRHDKVSSSAT